MTKNILPAVFRLTLLLLALLYSFPSAAQPKVDPSRTYRLPVDTRVGLAGNYGELRPNHFHGGLDFKTDQTIGHPVYAFEDGYVSRIGINAYGFGMVVYLNHPSLKLTSVYAHLSDFNEAIWKKVRARQVRDSLNNADITFAPDEIPVRQGDIIASSGNTGSSGGPHVHFELRGFESRKGADDEEWYDPMPFFLSQIPDTQAPRVTSLYLYPQVGEGVASSKLMTAWGRVGIAIKAYDYMDGQTNKYGLKHVRLYQVEKDGDKLLFNWNQDYFQYSEQRYTNSTIDYTAWTKQKSMIMKCFVEPGNKLRMIDHKIGDGIVNITEERVYKFRLELEDAHGNLCRHPFTVTGKKQPIPDKPKAKDYVAQANKMTRIDTMGVHITFPAGTFYTSQDLAFDAIRAQRTPCASWVYTLGNSDIPLHQYCDLYIDLPDSVATAEKARNLYLSNLNNGSSAVTYVPAKGDQPAQAKIRIRELGRFALRHDTSLPVLQLTSATAGTLTFTMTDEHTSVPRWRLLIDGKFIPLDMNNRGRFEAHPKEYGIKAGSHRIELTAWDLCGNRSTLTLTRTF